jgi:hypothetical protein
MHLTILHIVVSGSILLVRVPGLPDLFFEFKPGRVFPEIDW